MNLEVGDESEDRFNELYATLETQRARCFNQSALRSAHEARRLAKTQRKAIPYLKATFQIVNLAQCTLDPEVGREHSVELIALLESEDRARLLQPDLPESEYYYTVSWMTACGYDNLAEHTATMQGFNSEGMHACINDGILVCRRTGKLQCIACFREYAHDVHLASDDLDMAAHFARLVASLPEGAPGSERRWVCAKQEATLLLMRGQLEAAEEAAVRALDIADSYHTPIEARIESLTLLETVLLAAGRHDRFAQYSGGATTTAREIPTGEWLQQDLRWDERDALAACCEGRYDEAIERLLSWDRRLTQRRCLDEWFAVRLRVIAAHRLAGRRDKLEPLARQLESRARAACDWLTLRRLRRLMDIDEPASPLALAEPLNSGPYAKRAAKTSSPGAAVQASAAQTPDAPAPADASGDQAKTPLHDRLMLLASYFEQPDERSLGAALDELLQVPSDSVDHPRDAARAIFLLIYLVRDADRGAEAWQWAKPLADRFPQDASVLNLAAALGDSLRVRFAPELNESIPAERLETWFRKSLDLEPNQPDYFSRAAYFFSHENKLAEAERCLARGFRLDRSSSQLALRLANAYQQSDRPRDALAVLDLCLRDGSDDADVFWEASMTALGLEQYEVLLSYLNRFEQVKPDQPWTQYYRALALIETGQPAEAVRALDLEEQRIGEAMFPLHVLRASAAAGLNQAKRTREHVAAALAFPLSTIDYLTHHGLMQLMARLWDAAAAWPESDPLRAELTERLLVSGAAPNSMFELARQSAETAEGVNFYRCETFQPLDEDWPASPGCLPGQQAWPNYRMQWGVLARDEDEARRLLKPWQQRCYPIAAVCESVELEHSGFTDRPGVVWQGYRWCDEANDASPGEG